MICRDCTAPNGFELYIYSMMLPNYIMMIKIYKKSSFITVSSNTNTVKVLASCQPAKKVQTGNVLQYSYIPIYKCN